MNDTQEQTQENTDSESGFNMEKVQQQIEDMFTKFKDASDDVSNDLKDEMRKTRDHLQRQVERLNDFLDD